MVINLHDGNLFIRIVDFVESIAHEAMDVCVTMFLIYYITKDNILGLSTIAILTIAAHACAVRMLLLLICVIHFVDSSYISEKASFLANNAFDHHLSTSVIWRHSDDNIVTDFLINYHGIVKTIKIEEKFVNNTKFNYTIDYKQIVHFVSNPDEYEYFLLNNKETIIYPMRIILVITVPVKEISTLEEYTKISLDNDVSDVLIVSASSDEEDVTLSTYMPYGPAECGNFIPITLLSDATYLFPRKFKNYYGCPVKMIAAVTFPYVMLIDNTTEEVGGMDMEFMDLVFGKLNSSFHLSVRTNNSGQEVLKFVMNGTFDMVLQNMVLSSKRYRVAQITNMFKTMELIFCLPNQREIYEWAKILLPFFTNTTPLIILSFLLFIASIALVQRFGKYRKNSPKGVIFGTLALFLGQDMQFETKHWINNSLFMIWIWYCTIVRIAYQGDLVDGLQKTFLEPHIESGIQALTVVDEVGGTEGLLQNVGDAPINKPIVIMLWRDVPQYIKEISEGRKFLLITDMALIRHSPYKVQIVDERLSSLPLVYFMRPRWGAAEEINRIMTQIFESGFVTKIQRDYEVNAPSDTSSASVEPLTMTTVASCFYGLLILSLLWSIVLCVEIIWYKCVEEKKFNRY